MCIDHLSVFGSKKTGIGDEKESILCDFRQSAFSGVFIALSSKGVCAVLLGQDETILRQEFIRRFPNALFKNRSLHITGKWIGYFPYRNV